MYRAWRLIEVSVSLMTRLPAAVTVASVDQEAPRGAWSRPAVSDRNGRDRVWWMVADRLRLELERGRTYSMSGSGLSGGIRRVEERDRHGADQRVR